MPAPGMHSGVATDEALNLSMSASAVPLFEAVCEFIANDHRGVLRVGGGSQ